MKFSILKRVFYLLLLLGLPVLSLGDDLPGTLFSTGNSYYAKGRYKEALNTYQQLIAGGYQSAAVYFNMGNASYKNDDIPSALLYYEKARKLAPGDDDINFNLKYVNLKTTDKIEEVQEYFLARWWKGFILSFSVTTLALWSVILILLASGILVLYFFAGSVTIKKGSFYASTALFILGLITVFMANRQMDYFESHHQAIVFSGTVNVKNGPVETLKPLFVIHEGTKVTILDSNNGWMKISLANGNEGWIKRSDAKDI